MASNTSCEAASEGSTKRTIVTNLATIIRSLEEANENDNRKIALLLILCELIRTGKLSSELGRETEQRLFKSIGAHFLARLLVTRQNAPANNCSRLIYKSVCLSILTQFLSHVEIVREPLILTRISAFFDILKLPMSEASESADHDERTLLANLKLDTFKFLFAVARLDPEYLANNGLFDLLFNSVILNEAEAPEYKLLGDNFESSVEADLGLLACKLVATTLESMPNNSKPHRFAENFSSFLTRIDATKSKFKFQLVNYLNFLLSCKQVRDQINANAELNEVTARQVYSIVSELLRSKLEVQLAFFLLKHFVDMYQFEYLYMNDRKFFYFVIHLVCVQTALSLENASSGAQKLTPIDISLMSIYYQMLEEVIVILSTASPFDTAGDEDEDDDDDDEAADEYSDEDDDENYRMPKKESAKCEQKNEPELENVIKIVVELLESVMLYLKDELSDESAIDKLDARSTALVASSIRLLMCWLSHESLLEKEILELVPRFVAFAERLTKANPSGAGDSLLLLQPVDLFSFLSAGLQKIFLNLKARRELKRTKSGADSKSEFEIHELTQEMDKVKAVLDKCYEHMENDKP